MDKRDIADYVASNIQDPLSRQLTASAILTYGSDALCGICRSGQIE